MPRHPTQPNPLSIMPVSIQSKQINMQEEGDQQQSQDRKQVNPQQQHHEPQKCPRCDSLNTKFCYYNNYSLSQPRYFCKACRRYWTQGGTLRNVPVGGGCRKGKRAKIMSSSSSSATNSSSVVQPQDHQRSVMMSTGPAALSSVAGSQYYPGGPGYLTSLPFTQSLNHLGGSDHLGSGTSSNLSLLQGFNAISSFGQQRQMQAQFYQMGNKNMEPPPPPPPLYPSEGHQGLLMQSTRPTGSMTDWPDSFINKSHASAAAASAGQSAMWSTTMGNNTSTTSGAGPSAQWLDDLAGSYVAGPPQ